MDFLLSINTETIITLAIVGATFITLVLSFPFGDYFSALFSGAYISVFAFVAMKIKKINTKLITMAYIKCKKFKLNVKVKDLEDHRLASGKINKVITALVTAKKAKILLDWDEAAAIDLAGIDVIKAVKIATTPRVIETDNISTITKDGREIIIKCKITLRANLKNIIGGSREDNIIAKITEGYVAEIASTEVYIKVLEDAENISRRVLERGVDENSAYSVISLQISKIEIGRDIVAEIEKEKIETGKKIVQAKAIERKAMAVAKEQELRAKTQEMKVHMVAAEMEIPKAVAKAVETGTLDFENYYKMQNLMAEKAAKSVDFKLKRQKLLAAKKEPAKLKAVSKINSSKREKIRLEIEEKMEDLKKEKLEESNNKQKLTAELFRKKLEERED